MVSQGRLAQVVLQHQSADTDSVAVEMRPVMVFTAKDTEHFHDEPAATGEPDYLSWVLGGVLLLLVVLALRMRSNFRLFKVMLANLYEVRERHNLFDDTFKETAYVVVLNLLFAPLMGIILHQLMKMAAPAAAAAPDSIYVCIGVGLIYCLLMPLAYRLWSYVFLKPAAARTWLQGYSSAQAISALSLVVPAILLFLYPGWNRPLLWVCAGCYLLVRMIFIFKGLRIFIKNFYSWVVFLYYLCTIEIVPLIIAYESSRNLCQII